MVIRFDRIYQRDGRTDRRTERQTPHDGIGIALRDKNEIPARRQLLLNKRRT